MTNAGLRWTNWAKWTSVRRPDLDKVHPEEALGWTSRDGIWRGAHSGPCLRAPHWTKQSQLKYTLNFFSYSTYFLFPFCPFRLFPRCTPSHAFTLASSCVDTERTSADINIQPDSCRCLILFLVYFICETAFRLTTSFVARGHNYTVRDLQSEAYTVKPCVYARNKEEPEVQ